MIGKTQKIVKIRKVLLRSLNNFSFLSFHDPQKAGFVLEQFFAEKDTFLADIQSWYELFWASSTAICGKSHHLPQKNTEIHRKSKQYSARKFSEIFAILLRSMGFLNKV